MSVSSRSRLTKGIVIAAVVLTVPLAVRSQPPQGPAAGAIEPRADAVLKRMSHDLSSMGSFRVVGDTSTEVVLKSGEKIDFDATNHIAVKRPNKARSDRVGAEANMSFYYDGKAISLLGRRLNLYATSPAPGTIDQAIDFARDKLDLDLPAADLISSDPYSALTEDVVSGSYIDEATVDGVLCDHLAFRGHDVDFQLWVEKNSPRALPRKYTITSKNVPDEPEYTVLLHDWQPNVSLSNNVFEFTPPPGATKIDFLGIHGAGMGSRAGEGGGR